MAVLAEAPVHGYRLLQILEERDVQDWAAMSKPQVYYSLKKLARLGLVKPKRGADGNGRGPEREILALSAAGRRALLTGLDDERWATQRPPPPFLTWLALAPHLEPQTRAALIARRRLYVEQELNRERKTLAEFRNDGSMMAAPGRLMVEFTVRQFEIELVWLDEVARVLAGCPMTPSVS
jgi:DNA-binding PadR family transcriptional regulator